MLECVIAGGVELHDVVDELPTHAMKRYGTRPGEIDRVIVHHSGALGRDGVAGAKASARYVVRARDWPGFAYHYWMPYHPPKAGPLIVYRCQHDETRSYHTGGGSNNARGVGVCLQGDLTTTGPSDAQIECLEAFIPWAVERYGLTPEGLTWHSRAGRKQSCPGPPTAEWLTAYRDRM